MLDLLLAASLYGDPQLLFRFQDPRISESSGLVASSTTPGVLFTHNDSGDEPRFFSVGPDGRTRTTYTVPGVRARDWEDIARGPDEKGRSCLWLGDIGDNSASREGGILVRRVREPVPGGRARVRTEASTDFRLRYPDGPRDAETLLVTPQTGRVYVVTKPLAGTARVYAAPQPLDPAGDNLLELVASVPLQRTGTAGGPGIGSLAQKLVTGGDISPDGSRVALRTYTDVYEFSVSGEDLAAALDSTPRVSPLPATDQGEGLAYSRDGHTLLTSSEGAGAPVYQVRPVAGAAATTRSSQPPQEPRTPTDRTASVGTTTVLALGAGVALAALGLLAAGRRRYRSRDRARQGQG